MVYLFFGLFTLNKRYSINFEAIYENVNLFDDFYLISISEDIFSILSKAAASVWFFLFFE